MTRLKREWFEAENADLKARNAKLVAALEFILTDPPSALDEPDTDAEIIQHYREVVRAALQQSTEKP